MHLRSGASSRPRSADLAALRELLARAERPFAIVGGGGWARAAAQDMRRSGSEQLPAGAAFRRQDSIDNDSRAMSATSASGSTLRCRAGRDCGSAARRRATPRRDDDLRLHTARRATASADARARASWCRGARPRLSGRPADPFGHDGFGAAVARPAGRSALGCVDRAGACRLRGVAAAGPMPGPVDVGDCLAHLRVRCRTRSSQRRRQPHRVGAPVLALSRLSDASSRQRVARWATAFPPPSPPSAWPRSETLSASRATATS